MCLCLLFMEDGGTIVIKIKTYSRRRHKITFSCSLQIILLLTVFTISFTEEGKQRIVIFKDNFQMLWWLGWSTRVKCLMFPRLLIRTSISWLLTLYCIRWRSYSHHQGRSEFNCCLTVSKLDGHYLLVFTLPAQQYFNVLILMPAKFSPLKAWKLQTKLREDKYL